MMNKERLNSLIAAKFEKTGTWRRNEQQQAICDDQCQRHLGFICSSLAA